MKTGISFCSYAAPGRPRPPPHLPDEHLLPPSSQGVGSTSYLIQPLCLRTEPQQQCHNTADGKYSLGCGASGDRASS
eukprot:scaffold23294_cov85-Skeletonema_dohrnii-CCMP3373.AAC.1